MYQQLQQDVNQKCIEINNSFDEDTVEGRKVGKRRDNGIFLEIIKGAISKRYNEIATNLLLVGACLITESRLWESKVPHLQANMTTKYSLLPSHQRWRSLTLLVQKYCSDSRRWSWL